MVRKACSFWSLTLLLGLGSPATAVAQTNGSSEHQAMLNRYCITCHNEKLKTADLMLDKLNVADVSADAEVWERVAMKLRARAMPPVGLPRPAPDELQSFAGFLEGALDQAALAAPNPGRPADHRLNRTEYENAIRDLLDLEIDGAALLPPDNAGQGFDNIADILSVSPVLMESYMLAAGKISRLAVGRENMSPVADTYEVSHDFQQDARMSEDLPFGSRGGTAVRHTFPLDGEYVIQVRLQKNMDGYIRGIRDKNYLDVRIDGSRVGLLTIGGEILGRSGAMFTEAQNQDFRGDLVQTGYEFRADEELEVRFSASAGTRTVGVSFLNKNIKPVGKLTPKLMLSDIEHYKGGDPGVESVTIIGPYEARGVGDTPSRRKIFSCMPSSAAENLPCARRILTQLARRAYRRPVTDEDLQDLMSLYDAGSEGSSFEAGIELALQGILAGPEFLFRVEKDPGNIEPETAFPISDVDLASRLSFFLWSSIPDDELLDLASQGKLRDTAVLRQQVSRMLADPRSSALVDNFATQWLTLRDLEHVSPDPDEFPDFDDELRVGLQRETQLFFDSMLRADRGVVELLTADYTFVNERLARHYGIPDIQGSRFRRVAVNEEARRGLLGQGSILTVTSYPTRTSPVLRGKWVLENFLGLPPPPPPPQVPALEEKDQTGRALTMVQMMEQHRASPACAACHKLMDPIGFALENFDATGKWRTHSPFGDENPPIEATGMLFDGSKFDGVVEFRDVLLQHQDRFVHTVTEKLLTYALGRRIEHSDRPAVRKILAGAAPEDYRWSALITEIVKSTPFQMRRSRPL